MVVVRARVCVCTVCAPFSKGEADFYGIGHTTGSFGCAPKNAMNWWIPNCTIGDYTKKDPPYPGCPTPTGGPIEAELAGFLLIRGPYAWFGTSWQGCSHEYPFPPLLNSDFGEPQGVCAETKAGSGVWTREWSKASVKMDCSTGTPTITMKQQKALF